MVRRVGVAPPGRRYAHTYFRPEPEPTGDASPEAFADKPYVPDGSAGAPTPALHFFLA